MSNLFKIKFERPIPDDFNPLFGKIILSFMQPSVYFAYDYSHLFSLCSPKNQERMQVETAISSFLEMIEEELRSAYKQADDEKSK